METALFQEQAEAVAAAFAGEPVTEVRQFATGAQHFVFEALFEARAPLVVRLSRPEDRRLAAAAVQLSRMLRPLGVPLPEIFKAEIEAPIPFIVMERLPGADLGEAIGDLQAGEIEAIARGVAAAQAAAARMGGASRFGFAVEPSEAPFDSWADFVAWHVERSRKRLVTAALFDPTYGRRVDALLARWRAALEAAPATPFLHDTTTRNVIVAGGALSGIVDVDDLCFGDPRYVAALTRAALIAMDRPTDYVAAWIRIAEWTPDPLFDLYTAAYLLDLMSEHGQPANGNERASTAEARRRLEREMERLLGPLEA